MIEQMRRIGWLAVEGAVLVIVFCVLLNILLGKEGGSFISSVSENATKFLQSLPPGVTLGVSLIVVLYWFVRNRVR
jgi:NhaP-type Na+/H+ or K+/H+ antiporter